MSNELTTETSIDFLEQFTRDNSRKMWKGDLLKFVKGDYEVGQEEEKLPLGTKMIAIIPSMINGWIYWEDHRPVEYAMGVLVEGFRVPKREDLGDTVETDWEKDDNGVPNDPWQRNALMVMVDEDNNIYTFSTGSKGGLGALGELVGAYTKRARANPEQKPPQIPVIELQDDSYKHKLYGRVKTPEFKIVSWVEQAKYIALLNGAGEKEESEPKTKRIAATPKATPPATKGKKKNGGKGHGIRF
jgi:hypothetical protein